MKILKSNDDLTCYRDSGSERIRTKIRRDGKDFYFHDAGQNWSDQVEHGPVTASYVEAEIYGVSEVDFV